MAEYTLTTATAVSVGGSIPFNNTVVPGCGCIRHRSGSGNVKVKGSNNPYRYRVTFSANVTGVAGDIQAAIYLDGEQLPETLMSVVPVTADDVWTINTATEILADCSCENVSVRIVTGASVTVQNAAIIVEKEN